MNPRGVNDKRTITYSVSVSVSVSVCVFLGGIARRDTVGPVSTGEYMHGTLLVYSPFLWRSLQDVIEVVLGSGTVKDNPQVAKRIEIK